MYTICLIEGDGIGHEVVPAGRRLLEATGLPFTFTRAEVGWETFQRLGTSLPNEAISTVGAAQATLFGAVSSPLQPVAGYRSPIVAMRRQFDLYANLRPAISQPVHASRQGIDMLIVRENSEGLYSGRERSDGNEAVTERVITRRGSERIVRLAFTLAEERASLRSRAATRSDAATDARPARVTIVHKANVLRATCGLFREVAFEVAKEFPHIPAEEMLVDTAAMRLITEPERFDVLVTTNLFGDILSDEAAALVGGLGLAPAANIGASAAIFEPVHGSAPDIAGQGIANPVATFLASGMLLDYLNESAWATRVRAAVDVVLRQGPHTPDLGGAATTEDVTLAVLAQLA